MGSLSEFFGNLPGLVGLTSHNAAEWGTLLGALVLVIVLWQIWVAYLPLLKAKRTKEQIELDFGSDLFEEVQIIEAIQHYIEPDCSQVDPTGEDEFRRVAVVREKVFQTVDRFLATPRAEKHLLLLADSGMGKTSFLLNYYDRNRRKRARNRQRIAVLPLGRPDAINRIGQIEQRRDTVLFLDAFDEDTEAIHDHHKRLRVLMDACADFRRIVISCRTQFFHSDEEIPRETGVAIIAPRKAGESREYRFYKLYLLPLADEQVEGYVRRRFPFWRREQRRAARRIIAAIPEMSMRPMLLAVVPDLIRDKRFITELFELYEFMVESWLEREKSWIDKDRLRDFSELLAVDLYLNRQRRGFERIPRQELLMLKEINASDLDSWRLTARSLLNRDSDGNYKFAHRSILEYLFIVAFLKGRKECLSVEWTDLMKQIFVSWGRSRGDAGSEAALRMLRDSDFRGTGLLPLGTPRHQPTRLTKEGVLSPLSGRFDGVTYIQFPSRWQKAFLRVHRSGNKVVVCDLAGNLAWFLPSIPTLDDEEEKGSIYRIGFSDRIGILENLARENWLGRKDWRAPTLDEFDTLFAADLAAHETEKLLSETEYYWTADTMAGGGAIVVAFGPRPFDDFRARHLGTRTVVVRADEKKGYQIYEITEPQERLELRKQFTAQLARISHGAAEELWYKLMSHPERL